MGSQTIGNVLIAVLLFSAIWVGMSGMVMNMGNVYSKDYNVSTETFDRMNRTYSLVNDIRDPIDTNSTVQETNILDVVVYSVRGSWQALRMTFQIPDVIGGLIADGTGTLHLPPWFQNVITAIITLTIILLVLSALWKWGLI